MKSEVDQSVIKCGTHGASIGAIVCRHMAEAKEVSVGFIENSSDPDDLQAWCSACESFFIEEGEMTDRFRTFNDFKVVCDFCYANLKERHSIDPASP